MPDSNWKRCALIALVTALALSSRVPVHAWRGASTDLRAGQTTLPVNSTVIPISTSYGTLAFDGEIRRVEFDDRYEFQTNLTVTFRAGEWLNQTPRVMLRTASLIAAARLEAPNLPAKVLYKDAQTIDVVLNADGETKDLPPLTFHVTKGVATDAATLGLAVSDGRLLWPVTIALMTARRE